uniref:Uncharacterized protein n=1 Tax=Fagus sylvatica TaxID=28930 RepID=A0A2N9GUL3_FAGSY
MNHHHHPQETHPAAHGHAAKHESTIAVVKPAAKPCRADPNGLEVVEPCRSRPGGVGLGLEVVEPCRSRPGGVGLGLEVVEPCRLVAEKLILVAEKLI